MAEVEENMANIVVRVATPNDRMRVLAFTANTFSWGDYIERVFDRWLNDKSGRLLVAEVEDKVVGLTFVNLTKRGEVWLQGGRVDQNYRRSGVGEAMTRECLRIARDDMHATVARVITDKKNLPPQKLLSKLGFRIVSEFTELQKKVENVRNKIAIQSATLANEESIPETWKYLKNSPIFRKSSGLYTKWFVWYSLDEEDLRRFVSDGRAVAYDPGEKVHGVMLIDDTTVEAKAEKSTQSCYFDSDTKTGVEALSSYLVDYAAQKGLEKVRLWTYSDKKIINQLKKAGFTGEVNEATEIVWTKQL